MPRPEYRLVSRPVRSLNPELYAQLWKTAAESGLAVRIPLNGQAARSFQATIRNVVSRQGYRLHYRTDKDKRAILAWVVRKENAEGVLS